MQKKQKKNKKKKQNKTKTKQNKKTPKKIHFKQKYDWPRGANDQQVFRVDKGEVGLDTKTLRRPPKL